MPPLQPHGPCVRVVPGGQETQRKFDSARDTQKSIRICLNSSGSLKLPVGETQSPLRTKVYKRHQVKKTAWQKSETRHMHHIGRACLYQQHGVNHGFRYTLLGVNVSQIACSIKNEDSHGSRYTLSDVNVSQTVFSPFSNRRAPRIPVTSITQSTVCNRQTCLTVTSLANLHAPLKHWITRLWCLCLFIRQMLRQLPMTAAGAVWKLLLDRVAIAV